MEPFRIITMAGIPDVMCLKSLVSKHYPFIRIKKSCFLRAAPTSRPKQVTFLLHRQKKKSSKLYTIHIHFFEKASRTFTFIVFCCSYTIISFNDNVVNSYSHLVPFGQDVTIAHYLCIILDLNYILNQGFTNPFLLAANFWL